MAHWDRTYNEPVVGEYHYVTIEKPAGFIKVSCVGRGTSADPWIITYAASASGNSMDSFKLSKRIAGAPLRDGYLQLVAPSTTTRRDRPIVRDGAGGLGSAKAKGGAKRNATSKAGKAMK